ncbi:nitrous oxide reductase accessory protein NosL [Denitratisoma oestradiolicum]|uniref:Nitrous oxide reductase accessory protein NosL n=1 Tax=Denitratisoma oestradiolicum TaxID=311182 RepID=A0A6S6Y5T2_9PROT|nr:nitrous oxide reductase accessory protein NosL [Denitratisoma oestradiolicum]TWO80787.1 nitrous oxide reductase accessory protein NosL [Denitratisoma oestradiolicum]CAB1370897.1 Nitrous oxide reductase accessory protein NosL [Denitratisoma oestradiolicum]
MIPNRYSLFLIFALLAGCSPQGGGGTQALDFSQDTACALDGMVLAEFPGPKGQIHYEGASPEFFCDTVEVLAALLQPEQARKVKAAYVQDMGTTDWEKPRGHWVEARQAFYVKDSSLRGAMGPTLVSFASEAAAKAFVAKQGGTVLRFAQVTPDMVHLDGGALHDKGM